MAGPLLLLGLLACELSLAFFQQPSVPIVVVSELCYYPLDLDTVERQLAEDNITVEIMRIEGKYYEITKISVF